MKDVTEWITERVDSQGYHLIVTGVAEVVEEEVKELLLNDSDRFKNIYLLSPLTSKFKVIRSNRILGILNLNFSDCYITAKAMSELTPEDKWWILKRMRLVKYFNQHN